jgi:hypothetical protein
MDMFEYSSAVYYFKKESSATKDEQIIMWLSSDQAGYDSWEAFHLEMDDFQCTAYFKRKIYDDVVIVNTLDAP